MIVDSHRSTRLQIKLRRLSRGQVNRVEKVGSRIEGRVSGHVASKLRAGIGSGPECIRNRCPPNHLKAAPGLPAAPPKRECAIAI